MSKIRQNFVKRVFSNCIQNFRNVKQSFLIQKFSTQKDQISTHLIINKQAELLQQLKIIPDESWKRLNDKYNFSNMISVKQLFQILRKPKEKFTLNELIHILKKISNIYETSPTLIKDLEYYEDDFIKLLDRIKTNLKESTQEYPLIGSLAISLHRLKYKKDQEIWFILGDYFSDDRADTSFKEVLLAIEGFKNLNLIDQQFCTSVYDKLEDILYLWDSSSNFLKFEELCQVCSCYSFLERKSNNFRRLIENGFAKNLSDKHNIINACTKLIISLGFYHSKAKFDMDNFFGIFCDVLLSKMRLRSNEFRENTNGTMISYLVQTFGAWKAWQTNLIINDQIKNELENLMLDKTKEYTLQEILFIQKNILNLELNKTQEIENMLENKVFETNEAINYGCILEYLEFRGQRSIDKNLKNINPKILEHLDHISCKILESSSSSSIYRFVMWLEENDILRKEINFLYNLPAHVIQKIKDYDFEQMCYFYVIFNKHLQILDQNKDGKYHYYLDVLKDYIKIYYVAIPEEQVEGTSNFYKIFEVVNISDFYERGNY